jgi:glycosyltransferase involved in cell wall biosynthesis
VSGDVTLSVSEPLVSVIVTSYNYGEFIADCLRSVHAQTYERFECVVVDDCSTDETPAVVTAVLDELKDARLRYLRLPRNVGQLGAQVEGFRQSKGEFVVFLDADDLLFPRFIERHLFVHHNIETAVPFTSSNQWTISRDGQVLSKHHTDLVSRVYLTQGIDLEVRDADSQLPPVQGVLFPFWQGNDDPPTWVWGTQSTMMFRRALLAMILPSSPSDTQGFRTCSDFYIVRFGQLIGGSFVFREALGCYRRHGANNFSRNGLIAARMQTGDMRWHPALAAYRALVLNVLGERKEACLAVLGQARYAELVKYVRALPDEASESTPRLHRRLVRKALVRMLGEPAYVRLRLSLGKLIG